MSALESTAADVAATADGLVEAQRAAVQAGHFAEEIAAQAAGSGFAGIAQNVSRLCEAIREIHTGIGAAGGSVREASTAVTVAAKGATPQEIIASLALAAARTTGDQGKPTRTADALPTSPPRPMLSAPAVDGQRLVAALPVFSGPGSKTRGTLVGPDLEERPLMSEENPQTRALAVRMGLARSWAAETHVESHAAAEMHRLGLTEAILAVNKRPCRGVQGCDGQLARLLPPGVRLIVYGPDGFQKTYVGSRKDDR